MVRAPPSALIAYLSALRAKASSRLLVVPLLRVKLPWLMATISPGLASLARAVPVSEIDAIPAD
jgi:hypothetical protein